MALADPQSVTLTSGAVSLARTSAGQDQSTYRAADGTARLDVSHAYGKRYRRVARVTSEKVTTDPLNSALNVRVRCSAYVVLDAPTSGFSATEQKDILLAVATWLSANSGANAVKLVGGEN